MIFYKRKKETFEIFVNNAFERDSIEIFVREYEYACKKFTVKSESVFWEFERTDIKISTTRRYIIDTENDSIILDSFVRSFRKQFSDACQIKTIQAMKVALKLECDYSLKATTIITQLTRYTATGLALPIITSK